MIIKRQKQFSYASDASDEIQIDNLVLKKTKPMLVGRIIARFIRQAKYNLENSVCYNILESGKKIGEIELFRKSKDEVNIVWIGINKKYQGHGYAQKILGYFIQKTRKAGFKFMSLEVPGVSPDERHIYTKFGFKEDGRLNGDSDDIWGGLTSMRLNL